MKKANCPNLNLKFLKRINEQFNKRTAYQWNDILLSNQFISWFGRGKMDSDGLPYIDGFGNITNEKNETYNILLKSNFQNEDEVKKFFSSNFTKGVRLFKGSYYVPKTTENREYGLSTLKLLSKYYPGLVTPVLLTDKEHVLKQDFTHRLEINKSYFDQFKRNEEANLDIDVDELQDMPMMPTNIPKLESGEKTITIRPVNHRTSVYRFNDKPYKVTNRGFFTLQEFMEYSKMDKETIYNNFIGNDKIKLEHIQDWFEGKGPGMFVYDISNKIEEYDVNDFLDDPRFTQQIIKLGIILKKLQQRRKLSTISSEEKERLKEQISDLKEQIKDLKDDANRSLKTLIDTAEQHINTVEGILSREVNYANLTAAVELIMPYPELFNEFTDLTPDQERTIEVLNNKINTLLLKVKKVMGMHADSLVKKTVGKEILINGVAIPVKDDNTISAYSLGSSNSTNAIAQTITKKIKDAENTIDSENRFFLEEHERLVKELEDYQKEKGIKKEDIYKYMIQEDKAGDPTGLYVDKLGGEYFKKQKEAKDKSFLDWLFFLANEHTISQNTERYDNFKTNTQKWADEQVWVAPPKSKKTNEEYKEYKIKKMIYQANPEVMVNILNKVKKNQKLTLNEVKFAQRFVDNNRMSFLNKEAHKKWEDSKYTKIMELSDDNPLKKFYNHFHSNIKKGRKELGEFFDERYLYSNYIPEIANNSSIFKEIGNKLLNSLTEFPDHASVSQTDIITGRPLHQIPVWSLSGKMDASKKSYDLGKVLQVFTAQKFNKIYKEQIQDDLNLLLTVLREQEFYETDSKGNILKQIIGGKETAVIKKNFESNTYKAAQYFVDSNIYEQRQSKDGVLKTIYDKDIKEKIQEFVNLQKERGFTDEQINKDKYYGLTEQETKEYQYLETQFKEITGKKVVNNLIYLTTLKGLALNPFSGISELIQGMTSVFTEAAGNEFYNDANAKRALGLILHSTNPNIDKKKILSLMSVFGINEEVHTEVEKDSLLDKSFYFLKEANYRTRGLNMLAMLDAEKITDKKGVEHKLLDVIDVEKGHVVLRGDFDEVYTKFDSTGKPQITSEFNKLQQKISFMTKSLLSRDSSKDPILTNKRAIGRLLGQFRQSWMFEGINRRFGKEKDIPLLGRKTKGYYISVFVTKDGKLDFKRALRILWNYRFDKEALERENLSELDEANVRRVLREAIIIASTLAVYAAATLALMGDDDEEEDFLYRSIFTYILNQSYRVNRDLTFYLNPDSASELMKNIIPALKTVTDLKDILDAFMRTLLFDPYIYENTKKERLRLLKEFEEAFPFLNQPRRMYRKITESDKFLA